MDVAAQLVNQLALPAQLWTPAGDVAVSNRAFNELLGLDPQYDWRAEGRRFVDDPQLRTAGARELAQRALAGAAVDIAALSYTPLHLREGDVPGSLRLFIRLRPIKDEADNLVAVLCTVGEHAAISERTEHDLMRSQKMENVETLAGAVAHEFNNLFTGIRGLSELIRDACPEDSELAEWATLIGKNITRGAELIEKLSSFARELPHSLRRQNMQDYLKHALPLLLLQAPKRLVIETEFSADAPVLLDQNRMDQALANLVSNSRDATGGTGRVRLTLSRAAPPAGRSSDQSAASDGWLLLELEDSGPGIPGELLERVADPFFTTKPRGKSTGLGLSMTQRIVALHDGVLEIGSSESLGGASIRIFLPVAGDTL